MDQFSVGVSGIALASGVAKTVIEVQGVANKSNWIQYFSLSFAGVVSDVPVLVEIMRATAAATATTVTPAQKNPQGTAALAVVKHTATVEGTASSPPLESYYVTPNGGLFALQYPLGDEPKVTSTSFWRIRCTAPSNETVAVTVGFKE